MTPPRISFEVFPPQNIDGTFRLWDTLHALSGFCPDYVSVTYGAGGSTQELSHDVVKTIGHSFEVPTVAHITCVGASRSEVLANAAAMEDAGAKGFVALRGDPPAGESAFAPHPDGFANSCEMIAALRAQTNAPIRVGAYPDGHPEAPGQQANVDWLKAKIDAGASEAITQFFFEAESFLRFRDACDQAGIKAPITPGVLPIVSWSGAQKFAKRCGLAIPAWMDDAFEKATRDGRARLLATALCTELCDSLRGEGVEAFHFYTLNRPDLTRDVCRALGVSATEPLRDVA